MTAACITLQCPVDSSLSFSSFYSTHVPPSSPIMQLAHCQCRRFPGKPQQRTPWRFSASTSIPWPPCCGQRRYAVALRGLCSPQAPTCLFCHHLRRHTSSGCNANECIDCQRALIEHVLCPGISICPLAGEGRDTHHQEGQRHRWPFARCEKG